MIALIGKDLYELVPAPTLSGDYTLTHSPDDTIRAYKGTNRIEYGVSYYSRSKWAHIDRITGEITRDSEKPAHFRAIFGDFHLDITA